MEYSTHVRDLELRVKELAAELASFRTDVQPHPSYGPDETPGETPGETNETEGT
jgi:hypothetical protein